MCALSLAACSKPGPTPPVPVGITADNHTFFPIDAASVHAFGKTTASGTIACESCHPSSADSFSTYSCLGCHEHEQSLTDRLHTSTANYSYESAACVSCHPNADHKVFDHAGITAGCAQCHDVGTPFAALPKTGFTHPAMSGADCSACHKTDSWTGANGAPTALSSDPASDVQVDAFIPSYSGYDISALAKIGELLPMQMDHASTDAPKASLSACGNCHAGAASGTFFPGNFHSSLANLTLAQPTACASCHAGALPTGFVGPIAASPPRTPPSPEMKHDAVAWVAGVPSAMPLVPKDCGVCHLAPGQPGSSMSITWAAGRAGTSPALYHRGLEAGGQPQPTSCVDCHANSRPTGVVSTGLPAGLTFDHGAPNAVGDCAGCHAKSAVAPFTSWSGGTFHPPGSAAPSTCLPCHAGERPTSTTGWLKTDYAKAPFDYGTNAQGEEHGAGLDCVTCHANPGTGQWGNGQNWAGGKFEHTPTSRAGTTCLSCHTTQRPDLVLGAAQANTAVGFDHALNGTGDCFGCHQATVTAGTYASFFNAQGMLPGGDWKGGVPYPGSTFASSPTTSIKVTETKLNRSGPNNLVTSTTTTLATLYNGMLHVSAQLPAELNAGPTGAPDNTKCWHCHTSTGTTVTSFSNGVYHASLTSYRATPGGTVAPFPQPTKGCNDCHRPMLPADVVQKAASTLLAMDHAAQFQAAAMVGGKSVTSVDQADCSACHASAGSSWADGAFHSKIGTAAPKECVSCHYVLLADAAKSDHAQATTYAMKHRSSVLTTQSCERCHVGALAKATTQPAAAALWATGALHAGVPAQPAACNDCHAVSLPATTTQGSVTWTFTAGGTATNGAMWMSHASAAVAGKDCATCHAADAKATGSAWSKATALHAPVPSVASCKECHGLANGNGTVPGTKNNLPVGLTNSSVITSASAATGVAGQHDQISHGDANVGARDCKLCHTLTGNLWTSATFHQNLSAANPLIIDGSTGRCSNCHLNVKPGPGYTQQDHSTFTAAAGTQDCSACHSFPGTGTAAAPNWLGAMGAPTLIAVGGFTVPAPPAAAATTQAGIMSLPHPSVGTQACTACHASSGGGKNATGYDHASALITTSCNACHEAGSNLVGTVWNGATTTASGAGDTRPFTLTSLVAHYKTGLTVTAAKHFYPVDCGQCHVTPASNGAVTTGAAYASAWSFPHNQTLMTNPSTCLLCHTSGIPGAPAGLASDPNQSKVVTGLLPRFTGTSITSVSAQAQTLTMSMLHSSTEFPAAANSGCGNCHAGASQSVYYPGELHSSLANLALAQPTACTSCHANAAPKGFVGPTATAPARSPASGEMRHDAVAWASGAPTTTSVVPAECGLCHASPSATVQATWATGKGGAALTYHAALAAGAKPQPSSCLDCHANSRPAGVLTAPGAALAAGVSFDHGSAVALGDCATCHAKSSLAPFNSWTQGQFHLAGAATPATCLPCHAGERPTSTTGWASTTYQQAPFDYGTNLSGITHGDGQDCVTCHAGPGTGAWGSTQNWQNGVFAHASSPISAQTCVVCHTSQRPDRVLGVAQANTAVGFDHSTDGTGDCIGCHQATVVAGTYARYFNAGTGMLPNGDWKGGVAYPGSSPVSGTTGFITLTETTLQKTGALVTGSTTATATYSNAMLHVSAALPPELNAGPTGAPDNTKCWHCHTHSGTTVTSFLNGKYHPSLTSYAATPGGTAAPFPQPTARCADCHAQMLPLRIVMKAGSTLQPMDHSAQFTAAVTLGGTSVTAVNQADCSVCHTSPGNTWADGLFHANIGSATPKDCVGCHYPLMADAAKSDLTNGTHYAMKHRSTRLVFQTCNTCHPSALAAAAGASHAATLWATGAYHPTASPQPTSCTDCHAVSEPAANASTQSSYVYTLPLGGTATNGAQWNNHGATDIAGKDCVVCHAADAKPSGSAWAKSDQFHPRATPATCAVCHGTTNGKGTVIGTNNNLPLGLTNTTTVSASAGVAGTGIPAGALAQITHADVNVTAYDCGFCHTQLGLAATAPVQGKEWAQAKFHVKFTGAPALVMNGTTGRCSNCHLSEKPGTGYTAQDHSTFTAVSGSQDCSSCHSWPGNGTATSPDWKGASGVPQYISVGGFPISQPPATTATTQSGINNLPHPTVATGTACTTCHASAGGGKQAKGYDHLPASLNNTNCNACHEAGSNLVGTVWNGSTTAAGGAGDTRPFTATSVTATFSGNTCRFTNPNHFFPVNCYQCHNAPAGVSTVQTGTAYTTAWKFVHTESRMTNPATCNLCHTTCKKG
ncbi:MAG: hypothetical protein K1X89_19895 [Myxococcaceae bacterium]|nr:hypothetical protein [Myxococcaceae bacterium]